MISEILFKFKKSNSRYYSIALNLCSNFRDFTEASNSKSFNILKTDIKEIKENFSYIKELWSYISRWKGFELYIDNIKQELSEFTKIIEIIECSNECDKCIVRHSHCVPDYESLNWGCKYLTSIKLNNKQSNNYYRYYSSNENYWYEFGEFQSDSIWHINKNMIIESIKREIETKKIFVCKYFNDKKIKLIIDKLPNKIDLTSSTKWEKIYEDLLDGNSSYKIPIGIKYKNESTSSTIFSDLQDNIDNEKINSNSEPDKIETKKNIPKISYDDIGGIDQIITEIREVIELPLKRPELFKYLSIKPHKGVLLYGPPGCGKTMLAKAIANEVDAHFISIRGPELFNKYVGQSEENLRKIFNEAQEMQPSIIYFDEIDSIAQFRSSDESVRHSSQFLNQLLTLMDGVKEYSNVCIIGSTNRLELMDKAILRPGRFDYVIEIKKPTKLACYQILKIETKNMPIDKNVNLHSISELLNGFSGAEIAFISREAAYNCLRKKIDIHALLNNINQEISYKDLIITELDFIEAIKKVKSKNASILNYSYNNFN